MPPGLTQQLQQTESPVPCTCTLLRFLPSVLHPALCRLLCPVYSDLTSGLFPQPCLSTLTSTLQLPTNLPSARYRPSRYPQPSALLCPLPCFCFPLTIPYPKPCPILPCPLPPISLPYLVPAFGPAIFLALFLSSAFCLAISSALCLAQFPSLPFAQLFYDCITFFPLFFPKSLPAAFCAVLSILHCPLTTALSCF